MEGWGEKCGEVQRGAEPRGQTQAELQLCSCSPCSCCCTRWCAPCLLRQAHCFPSQKNKSNPGLQPVFSSSSAIAPRSVPSQARPPLKSSPQPHRTCRWARPTSGRWRRCQSWWATPPPAAGTSPSHHRLQGWVSTPGVHSEAWGLGGAGCSEQKLCAEPAPGGQLLCSAPQPTAPQQVPAPPSHPHPLNTHQHHTHRPARCHRRRSPRCPTAQRPQRRPPPHGRRSRSSPAQRAPRPCLQGEMS